MIVLKEVVVRGSRLNAEQKGETSNLSDILANVKADSKTADTTGEEQPAAAVADYIADLAKEALKDMIR